MRHGSLFSGIGGFDLAAEWMGWENVFHCENNGFCQKILKHYWPDAKSYGDIKETDFSQWKGRVDIISGGFPCQPYSQAGKRKGKEDERHLWPEMLRAITEVQPRWVVGENVSGLLNWNGGMVLDEIKADLEAAGFEVFPPLVLPACGKNAKHKRDRLWMVAHADGFGSGQVGTFVGTNENRKYANDFGSVCNNAGNGITTYANGSGQQKRRRERISPIEFTQNNSFASKPGICRGDNGFSNRVDRIKALGNAVVPQVVYEIFKAIEKTDV